MSSPRLEESTNQKFKILLKNSKWPSWLQVLISETVRYRAKRIKIWVHKGYKSEILVIHIYQNSKFYKKNQNGRLDQKCYLYYGERWSETDLNLGSQGLEESNTVYHVMFAHWIFCNKNNNKIIKKISVKWNISRNTGPILVLLRDLKLSLSVDSI